MIVLDASATLAWAFERQDAAEAAEARALLKALPHEDVLVPELWHLEVLNALVVAARRGVIEVGKAVDFIARLNALPIRTDDTSLSQRKGRLFDVALEHGLTAYDAAYLDLAMRGCAVLATFDRRLASAAERAGVARFKGA